MKQSVALKFTPGRDMAPRVVATGEGFLAEEIERLAIKNGVAVIKDELLVKSLGNLGLGVEIPENLYRAVAILFQYLWERESKSNRGIN
ncbi:EscU/YscU/HrcU family type III secretion system export apparatus switch protein [Leptospira sp. GIMC2001]|uniref:EscU/YscU/HrcU family type III secretion system export apparatus switch protein n=1 Tax=Leptospira sp. GIMC2001 TaxID=1513297 RepID=UPI0004A5C26D|nr:EscU/YscU/HrcU family type III secretion system export apparatus switch protein [Leptospira sp. GIMC2001]AID56249.1 flagellar biosynthesis protein FlhB [Leptospira sp. GIMC2001]WCL47927.1 EscU/YscU/HrcU family type III secretion system export apparatus switch protein [Leptospira sp. GIMC2001]